MGLVVSIIVLWNTVYIDTRCATGSNRGICRKAEGLAVSRLLVFDDINLLGRYSFSLPDFVQRGQLRPLRNPSEATEGRLFEPLSVVRGSLVFPTLLPGLLGCLSNRIK